MFFRFSLLDKRKSVPLWQNVNILILKKNEKTYNGILFGSFDYDKQRFWPRKRKHLELCAKSDSKLYPSRCGFRSGPHHNEGKELCAGGRVHCEWKEGGEVKPPLKHL